MVSDIQINHAKPQKQRRGQRTDHDTYIFRNDQHPGYGLGGYAEFAADADHNREEAEVEGICSQTHDQRHGQGGDDQVGVGTHGFRDNRDDGSGHFIQHARISQDSRKYAGGEQGDDHAHGCHAVFFQLGALVF